MQADLVKNKQSKRKDGGVEGAQSFKRVFIRGPKAVQPVFSSLSLQERGRTRCSFSFLSNWEGN